MILITFWGIEMLLSNLLMDSGKKITCNLDPIVTGLTSDSRKVKPGNIFVAIEGNQFDGTDFISEAIDSGAVAIIVKEGFNYDAENVEIITESNVRRLFARISSNFFKYQPRNIVAITGTNGKTSVGYFCHQIWETLGCESAFLGTLGLISKSHNEKASLTTPDPVSLHKTLDLLSRKGTEYVAFEASSHGLSQHRLDGVKVTIAAFTNFSRDHLDYHGSMSSYFNDKMRLFSDILVSDGLSVLNADIPEYRKIVKGCKLPACSILSYGWQGEAIRLLKVCKSDSYQKVKLDVSGKQIDFSFPLVGEFQLMNALCAGCIALASGMQPSEVIESLSLLECVPGRLELVGLTKNHAHVYIDYAHTPSAISAALEALRSQTKGSLKIIIGAGGDRDTGKRAIMGKVSSDLADDIYVTDDNPRFEDPAVIRKDILRGCPGAIEISDRSEAIYSAIKSLNKGDILLISGKGHETGQFVRGSVIPFSDRDTARSALEHRNNSI